MNGSVYPSSQRRRDTRRLHPKRPPSFSRRIEFAAATASAGLFILSSAQIAFSSGGAPVFLACASAASFMLTTGPSIAAAGAALAALVCVAVAFVVRPRSFAAALALGAALAVAVVVAAPDPPCPALQAPS